MFTLAELSEKLAEPFEGDGATPLKGVAEITSAQEGDLSFVANPKYVANIASTKASALIVPKDLETGFRPLIRSVNPYLSFTKALHLFHDKPRRTSGGVDPAAHVHEGVQLGHDVTVMAHAMIEEGAVIEDRTVIYPGVFIGKNAHIGRDATLYPNVFIYEGCQVGERTILHAGCRIGGLDQVPGSASVILEADLELGANVVVASGLERPTRIQEGTKIDNLVQVGPGAVIGPHCIIVSQVMIGQGATLDERVTIAGQVVVTEDVTIGASARIGAQSVVTSDVPPDSDFWGSPAQSHRQEKRLKANIARLPKLFEKIHQLEDKISESK